MIDSKTIKLIENSIEEIDEKREIPEELLSELIQKMLAWLGVSIKAMSYQQMQHLWKKI